MPSAVNPDAGSLDAGYRVLPLPAELSSASLRIGLVVRDAPDAIGGPFVLLRDLADASIYLGAVTDAAGRVREWLEIWAQNIDRISSSFPAYRQFASNQALDERWRQRAEELRNLEPAAFISTGWESTSPAPIFYDAKRRELLSPTDAASGAAWALCCDDAVLAAKGLPAYAVSLSRYLHRPGADTPFVPVTSDAPENDATQSLATAFPRLLPFHPGARLLVRTFAPIGYEDWVDVLSGAPWPGLEHGREALKLGGGYRTLQDATTMQFGGGHLFLGNRGLAGRLAETFHLKLHALTAAFRLVRAAVQGSRLPLLNLSSASFRVRLAETDAALPFLWNFQTTLAVPGEAIALPVETTSARYFIPAKYGGTSVYRPTTVAAPVEGAGEVRLRKVLTGKDAGTSLEGTLVTQEKLTAGGNDLVWLRLPLPSGRVDLYANLESPSESAPGELRFRTLPQALPVEATAALRQAEGVPLPAVPFQTVPLLSSPCDLYALGVLAVRTLLVDAELSLPVALDELFSLARKSAATYDPEQPTGERLRAIAEGRPQIAAALGPHRLIRDKIPPEAALFPPDLWWDAIGLLLRLFPGLGPDSLCRDFGDAPPLALENVFHEPIAALENLLLRSRSLIVLDWNYNREIRGVIGKFLERAAAH